LQSDSPAPLIGHQKGEESDGYSLPRSIRDRVSRHDDFDLPGHGSDGKARSRFAGSYTGKYIAHRLNADDQQEEVDITIIDDKGNISGEATNTTLNQTVKLTGTIDEDGRVRMVYELPTATYTATGTYSKTRKGTIIGTLTQWSGMRAMGVIELELTPKP
jgi:hypothetical protein